MRKSGKVVQTYKQGNDRAYVIWDAHWGEWRCEVWINGEHQEDADYHTDDRKDAYQTAAIMLETAGSHE